MNRRQWLKSSAALSGGLTLAAAANNKLFTESGRSESGKPALKIQEIHLVNLSHTDFGYTDLPSSAWEDHVNNVRLAMKTIQETADYAPDARFKWTMESLWIMEKFWEQATAEERNQFDSFVEKNLIEVTAMPGNMSCLVDATEWERELDRLAFFFGKFKPRVAIQDDVNGLPWGMVESLLNRNVEFMVMGANPYSGGVPIPAPSFFLWQGAGNGEILMYNGEGYANGFDYFHTHHWRRGPVPNRYDLWFNPPTGNEIFSSREEDVRASSEVLKSRLESLAVQGYPHSALQLSFTNHWTMDNDLPCRQLSEFIRTWNELGLRPRLVFSTPARFYDRIQMELPVDLPKLRGEWCDWWADGIAASPAEVSVLQAAKRRNRDIGGALRYFSAPDEKMTQQIEQLNHDLVFACEHTWGAYDSVARPYGERTVGNYHQKFEGVYRADENSKRIRAEMIRKSRNYKPLSRTAHLEVMNPGTTPRSGWVDISAQALRIPANAVQCLDTGRVFPFEQTLASEWSSPDGASEPPEEIPNDVWPYHPGRYRFFVENLKPGEVRRFELVDDKNPRPQSVQSNRFFRPVVDGKSSRIKNIIFKSSDKPLFDEQAGHLPAELIVERPQGKFSRNAIADRNLPPENLLSTVPSILDFRKIESPYALRYQAVLEEKCAKRIEQQWNIFDSIPRIEITTTLWLRENLDPLALYMAFPFALQSPRAFYSSLGSRVEVGVDQMPGTCGEYNTVQNGVGFRGREFSLALTTLDSPLGIFDAIQRGRKRVVFKPQSGYFFNLICQNYWITNFSVLYPTKITVRHVIECGQPGTDIRPLEGEELWGYPSV